ncbi:ABC transporter ATP-binding protein [Patescibacteria group bacterium]|nr:ABC transporter ATP-binding protein [Patescibacteria group bacterium]
MEKKVLQKYLYQKRSLIKQRTKPLKLEKSQIKHIKYFCKKNKKLCIWIIVLSATATFLQVFIPFFASFYVKRYSFLLEINRLFYVLLGLVVFLIVYLIISFFSIKYEKTFIVKFLNYLRYKWFALYLDKNLFAVKTRDQSKIIAKISYHFALLQMGISNSLFSIIHWLFLAFSLLIGSFFINSTLLIVVLISLPVTLLVSFMGYIVAKYYVSQDQTLYSKILVFIGNTLGEFSLTKLNRQEKESMDHLNDLVNIDTYFRIRRELLLNYGNKIIFSLVILAGALIYLVEIYQPFLKLENSFQYLVYAIFVSLIIRLFYLSLRIGLFSFPLKLGAALCIPNKNAILNQPKKSLNLKSIKFKSQKFKLGEDGEYVKDLEFKFKKGQRVLICGKEAGGKTSLGIIFSGNAPATVSRPWTLRLNGKYLLYREWQKFYKLNTYIIHPDFQTDETIVNVLLGKSFSSVSNKNLEKIFNTLSKYSVLDFITKYNRFIAEKIDKRKFSFIDKALIQMAHVLLDPPSILVIDNAYIDLDSERIKKMLSILDKELKQTIVIVLSTKNQKNITYDKKYNLGD